MALPRNIHTLFGDFEYSGHWWLPDDLENKVAGTVRFDGDRGIELELLEPFREPPGAADASRPKLILGLATDRTPITLYQTLQTGPIVPGLQNPTFHANYAFLGNHFFSREDIRFSSLSVNFTYLEEWMGHATFEPRSPSVDKIVANYSAPEEVKEWVLKLDAGITIYSDLSSKLVF